MNRQRGDPLFLEKRVFNAVAVMCIEINIYERSSLPALRNVRMANTGSLK